MKTSTSSSGGIGFAGLLTVAFIVLKLCGVVAIAVVALVLFLRSR